MLLEQRILDLQKDKGTLIDKVRELKHEVARLTNENKTFKDENVELKEQIEKMKCCENCCHYSHTYEHCYPYPSYQNCKSLSNWRLAE